MPPFVDSPSLVPVLEDKIVTKEPLETLSDDVRGELSIHVIGSDALGGRILTDPSPMLDRSTQLKDIDHMKQESSDPVVNLSNLNVDTTSANLSSGRTSNRSSVMGPISTHHEQ